MKYSSKMDIEYTKGDLSFNNVDSPTSTISGYSDDSDDEQRRIDKRLKLIQQEENAPSEARIIATKQNQNEEVINPIHVTENKKLEKKEKIEKLKAQNSEEESSAANIQVKLPIKNVVEDIKSHKLQPKKPVENFDDNVTITSKVLVGRFPNFEEARKYQTELKAKDSSLSPFVRKVGDVYSLQMGSYQEFSTAKAQAQKLKSLGLDVWIYQQ